MNLPTLNRLNPATFCESHSIWGHPFSPFVTWSPETWPTRNIPSPHRSSVVPPLLSPSHSVPSPSVNTSYLMPMFHFLGFLHFCVPSDGLLSYASLENGYMSTLGLWMHTRGKFCSVEVLVRIFGGLLQMLVMALILHQHWVVLPASLGPDYDTHIQGTRTHDKYRNALEVLWIWF